MSLHTVGSIGNLNLHVVSQDISWATSYMPFHVEDDGGHVFSLREGLVPEFDAPAHAEFDDENGHSDVFKCSDGWGMVYGSKRGTLPLARLRFTEHFRQAELQVLNPGQRRLAFDNALMMQYAFASSGLDTLLLHSSVVVYKGKGYLFLGRSGTGKSTHSRLWLENIPTAYLLNDDNPVVRIIDGRAWVFGSPWSGKTPCYRREGVPVGAVVRLRQRPENTIRVLRPVEAFAALKPTASVLPCVPEVENGVLHTLEQLASLVPFYTLDCRPDRDAAWLCHQTVTALK